MQKLPGVVFYFFEVVITLYMFVFRELSSLAKCKVREETTPRQFVKNKVRKTLRDLGYFLDQAPFGIRCSTLNAR